MKRFLSLLISMMLIVSSVGVVGYANGSEHWAYDSIKGMLDSGIISGDQNGNLNLDNLVTRAEFAKVINRYFGFTLKSTEGFNDVDESAWYYNDLLIAKGQGYMVGDQNKNANPDANITRAEVAVIIARITGLEDDSDLSFSDSSMIPEWAKGKIGALVKKGIIKGYEDGSFGANKAMTRAEAFVVISRNPSDLNDKSESAEIGNLSSAPLQSSGDQGAYERPSGSGGGGGGGGSSSSSNKKAATLNPRYFNKDTGELEFIAENAKGYKIKFVVNGTPYEKTLELASESGNYKYASFLSFKEALINEVGTNGFNADVFVKAKGATGYEDSGYLEFGQIYCKLDIPDVENIKVAEGGSIGEYTATWNEVTNSDDYLVTIYSDKELKNKVKQYTSASTTQTIDLSECSVGSVYYVTVDAKSGNHYGVSETYGETVTIGFGGGDGSSELPYEIYSSYHLGNVKSVIGKSYKLMANVDTNEVIVPLPKEFSGNFDGNGNTINATVTGSGNVALFPKMSSGAIKNLTVTGSFGGTGYVSAFVSQTSGPVTFENCINKATITSTSGASWIGGIAARTYDYSGSKFINCINYGDVTNGSVCAGGIVGVPHTVTTIEKCANFGTIKATDRTGGIVGEAYNSEILYSYNFGKITAPTAGGIFALCNKDGGTTAIGCFNAGKIEGVKNSAAIGNASSSGTDRIVVATDCYNIIPDIKMADGGSKTLKNCFTVTGDDISDGLTNVSPIELVNIKPSAGFTILSENSSNDSYNKGFIYPQIVGNLIPYDYVISDVNLGAKDLKVTYNEETKKYYLSWTAATGGIPTAYKVYIDNNFVGETSDTAVEISSYVEEAISYDFKVITVFDGIEFETTKRIQVPVVTTTTDIGKPTNVMLKYDHNSKKFNLVWNKSTEADASKFEIYINDEKVGETTDGATEIFDITSFVSANTTYTARVDAVIGYKIASSESVTIDTTLDFYSSNGISGSGTEADPYIIDDSSKFTVIFGVNNTDASTYGDGVHYKITENLTISGHKSNSMIFRGVLFADENKTIDFGTLADNGRWLNQTQCNEMGIKYDNSYRVAYSALFALANGATIKNITLSGAMSNSNAHHQGGFVAVAKATTIENCVNNINMPGTSPGTNGGVGGFVGAVKDSASSIINCVNNGVVTGKTAVGGIVGISYGTITDCTNYGNITGTKSVGGIVGDNYSNIAVTGCKNYGDIKSTDTWAIAGGIVACQRTYTSISKCANFGDITCGNGANSYAPGGIIGFITNYGTAKVTVSECMNAGNVSAQLATAYPGAIIGDTRSTVEIRNTFNTGSVTGGAGQGRVIGSVSGLATTEGVTIMNFYDIAVTGMRTATATATSAEVVINKAYGLSDTPDTAPVTNNFYNVSSDTLKTLIENGDFSSDIWEIREGSEYSYPTLISIPYPVD